MSNAHPNSPTPEPSRLAVEPVHDAAAQDLVLVKNGQRYVFRCQSGEEAELITRLRQMVDDPDVDLNWFDVAVLSHQVGQRLAQRLEQVRKP